jgi:hypothetical protein
MLLEQVMFCMLGPFFSLRVPYIPLIIWVVQPYTRTFHLSSSAPLNLSVRLQIPACRGMLYERAAAQVPSLYVTVTVCPVENVLGRVPDRASDSMLSEWQLSQYNSSLLQEEDPKGSCSGFKTRQRDWKPAVDMTFNIERQCDLRYRIRNQYTISES